MAAVRTALHSDWHDFVSHEIVAVREIIKAGIKEGVRFWGKVGEMIGSAGMEADTNEKAAMLAASIAYFD